MHFTPTFREVGKLGSWEVGKFSYNSVDSPLPTPRVIIPFMRYLEESKKNVLCPL